MTNVMVFEYGAFRKWLGHEDQTLVDGTSEDTAKRQSLINQEAGPHQMQNLLVRWS